MKIKCIRLTHLVDIPTAPGYENFRLMEDLRDYLVINKIYRVYGISIWKNTVNYLISNPREGQVARAEWHGADLFEIIDPLLAKDMLFYFASPEDKRGITALWGYKELIEDYDHYSNLIEMREEATRIFWRRTQEMDE